MASPNRSTPAPRWRARIGLPLPPPVEDADGDGYKATAYGGKDCNDNDPTIHPGALDIPGDHIDQNCDKLDRADPVLSNEVSWHWRRYPTRIVVKRPIRVAGPLLKGTTVILRCKGPCSSLSRRAVRLRHRKHGALRLGRKLVGHSLRAGARVFVTLRRRGSVGLQVSYLIRRRKPVKVTELCVPPGKGSHPRSCG